MKVKTDSTRTIARRDIWIHMLLYPAHTLPTAAAPVIVAIGLALHNETLRVGFALTAFLAGWLIQLGGVLTDNYENLVRNPNDQEHPALVQGIRDSVLTLRGLRKMILTCYFTAMLAGAFLVYVSGFPVLVIGLLSIGASWIYSAGPFPFGEKGLADPLFFVFFGVVSVMGSYFVQAAPAVKETVGFLETLPLTFPLSALLLGLPIGALTTNILIIDDIRDKSFDAKKGKRTVAVRFGVKWSRIEFLGLLIFSYLVPLLIWLGLRFSAWALLPYLTVPFAIKISRDVLTLDRFVNLVPTTPKAARLLLAYSVLLAIGVAQP